MARPPRFVYPGAVYHVMARGDGGKAVFETDDDRKVFLARLGEVCGSRGWRVHAWVLMGNHFHLLLETPEANQVSGMKWLLGTFTQGWMDTERVLRSFELAENGRERRAYVAWIEARAANPEGAIGEEAQAALRRGWHLGEERFRDKLLGMIDKAKGVKPHGRKSPQGPMRDHREREAERLIEVVGRALGLPADEKSLAVLRKGDERNALLAAVLRLRTTVGTEWIAQRLHMGHPGSVSRSVLTIVRGETSREKLTKLEQM